jgi:hypothetical protein
MYCDNNYNLFTFYYVCYEITKMSYYYCYASFYVLQLKTALVYFSLFILRIGNHVSTNPLKSRDFQAECVLVEIQVLSAHFAQWN